MLEVTDGSMNKGVGGALGRLRSFHLTLVLAAIFLADLAIPDALPFLDELVLAAATLLMGRWQARRRSRREE